MSKVSNYEPPPQYIPANPSVPPVQPNNPSMQPGVMNILPNQPTIPVVWMKTPPPMSNCPPGLEYLASLDKVLIQQEINQANALTGFEKNRYIIRNLLAEQIYIACENPTVDASTSEARAFVIQLFDCNNREVMRISRDGGGCKGCGCCICCCKSCAFEAKVETPNGQVIGYIRQGPSCCSINFGILDAEEKLLFNIIPPTVFQTVGQVDFDLRSVENDKSIGQINKFFAGEQQEYFTKADNFGINVPVDLPVPIKAIILGAVFFIDFLYFESTPLAFRTRRHHHSHHHGHRHRRRAGRRR